MTQEHHDLLEQDDSCTAAFKHFFSGRSLDRHILHPTFSIFSCGQNRNKNCTRLQSVQCRRLACATLSCYLPGRVPVPGDQPASKSSLDPFICKACAVAERCEAAVLLEIKLRCARTPPRGSGRDGPCLGEVPPKSAVIFVRPASLFATWWVQHAQPLQDPSDLGMLEGKLGRI